MKRVLPVFFLVFWTGALCAPSAVRFLVHFTDRIRFEPFPVRHENREPTPRPSLFRSSSRFVSPQGFGRACEAWYDDSFPWRTELLRFHRRKTFDWLKSPVGREVPGRGNWVFRRGGDWPELDDYLGAKELSPEELSDWIELFEGRREWARALGAVFLTLPATTKAQARWQELYPAIRRHRGRNVGAQVREALADSPARDDVLFADDDFDAAFAAGRETFYDVDHHPNAYGEWILYEALNRRLRELFPDRIGASIPWYDDPPPDVLSGEAPGCWEQDIRLAVSSPGEVQDDQFVSHRGRLRYPFCNVSTVREGGGLEILMIHDSFMRFSLASWRGKSGDVRFPFASGVGRVRANIFHRFTTGYLETVVGDGVPDVFIEQFPQCRLDGSVRKYLDSTMRFAAAFGRAAEPEPGRAPQAGDRIAARAVFDDVRLSGRKGKRKDCIAVLRCDGREIARRAVMPGVKRAVFFEPVVLDEAGELTVALKGGSAASADLAWRLAAPAP